MFAAEFCGKINYWPEYSGTFSDYQEPTARLFCATL